MPEQSLRPADASKRFRRGVVVYLKPAQFVVGGVGDHEQGGLAMSTKNESAHPGQMGAGFRIEVRAFRPCVKNTLKAFVSLRVSPPGMLVNDVCVHEKNGKRWLSLPARAYQRDGTTEWVPVVQIEDPLILKQFQSAGLAAITRYLNQGGER